jgi:phospholipid/cholesterol/gamma-HCH transport system permease protein
MGVKRFDCPTALDRDSGRGLLEAVRQGNVAEGETVLLNLAETRSVTSPGGAWLMEIASWVRARKGIFQLEGQTGTVAEFMELIRPGFTAEAPEPEPEDNPLQRMGGAAIDALDETRAFLRLAVDSIYWTFIAPFDGRGFRGGLLLDELHEMGVRAVKINFMMNFLLGLIIAMLSAAQLSDFGAVIFVADLTTIAFTRELAAVMTATVVAARTGAAIAAELATMKVQEEIDALRGMGLNVSQFLVAPKVLALLIAMPCLVALGMFAGIAGGSVWGIVAMGIDPGAWGRELLAAAEYSDIIQGMMKAVIFAYVIVLIGCHNGLRVTGGSRGVGLMTTRAVVMDIFAIICIDMVFAAVFYYVLD